jgi:hypothetical protein
MSSFIFTLSTNVWNNTYPIVNNGGSFTGLTNIYFLGPFGTFNSNAFDNISPTSTLFYNSLYPSYQTYTTSFYERVPFTLIPNIEQVPSATSAILNFSLVVPESSNKTVSYSIINNKTNLLIDSFSGINLTQYVLTGLTPSTSYDLTLSVSLNPVIQTLSFSFSTTSISLSNICFYANTMIQTDQGKIPIQLLNPKIHTIKHNKILAITQSINTDEYCVLFKPHAFQKNVPSHPTIMTMNHQIFNETTRKMEKAKYFLNKNNDKICRIQYDGSILYNILMIFVMFLIIYILHQQINVIMNYF